MRIIRTWSRRELLFVRCQGNEQRGQHRTRQKGMERRRMTQTRRQFGEPERRSWRLDRSTCYLLSCVLDKQNQRDTPRTRCFCLIWTARAGGQRTREREIERGGGGEREREGERGTGREREREQRRAAVIRFVWSGPTEDHLGVDRADTGGVSDILKIWRGCRNERILFGFISLPFSRVTASLCLTLELIQGCSNLSNLTKPNPKPNQTNPKSFKLIQNSFKLFRWHMLFIHHLYFFVVL